MKDDRTAKQLRELNYDLVLLGHIHKPQTIGDNITVMGSVMAHSFHEANETKFFYVFDTETRELKAVNSGAPQFITMDVETKAALKKLELDDRNYYRLNILTSKITPTDTSKLAGRNVIISYGQHAKGRATVVKKKRKTRTIKDEVTDYYNALDTDLEKKRLKTLAMEVVNARS
jgi:DNA repair exonuclease SbcCD nuclease subunit